MSRFSNVRSQNAFDLGQPQLRLDLGFETVNPRLADLPLSDLQTACDKITVDVKHVLGTANAVAALRSFGSGGREPVLAQIAFWKEKLT